MTRPFPSAMRRALEQVQAGDPSAATRIIQDAFGSGPSAPSGPREARPAAGAAQASVTIDGTARRVDPAPPPREDRRRPLGQTVDLLRQGAGRLDPGALNPLSPRRAAEPDLPAGAVWQRLRFSGRTGARDYRLFIPASAATGAPAGLVMLLHGCTQTPEDFAVGTGMLPHADRAGLIVVLPEQTQRDNAQSCWNWFRPADQTGTEGEPALLAELALQVAGAHGVPRDRIFAAGLSAGGAMAAILGAERPDVFSAIGVHSGLPAGAARDVAGAFAAMRSGGAARRPVRARSISFHGTADTTVSAANGQALFASAGGGQPGTTDAGRSGRSWRCARVRGAGGQNQAEHWEIDGLGHAWSGGDPRGSYADPQGPDASAEMVRFFLT